MAPTADIQTMTAHLFRENSGKMVAVLARIYGLNHIDTIMDMVQDTFEKALTSWKYNGVPENPGGWLMQVAKNKSINYFKREGKSTAFSHLAFTEQFDESVEMQIEHLCLPDEMNDSQLRLLLACCQPDFSEKNQVILTLHILCGFGISEIANALLMSNEAVKKSLFRTKEQLRQRGNLMETALHLRDNKNINLVHTILYLLFNEGYKTTRSKDITNNDLCYEAMRLARLLLKKGVGLPDETNALLALMFFNISRFPSRLNTEGEIVTLEDQDRKKWNKVFIEEGYHYLKESTKENCLSRFHLEAMIASIHCASIDFAGTDWSKIIYLYRQLETIAPSPMVTLNRIVAESFVRYAPEQLAQLNQLKLNDQIKNHYLLYAAEGEILRKSGQPVLAKDAFSKALTLAATPFDKQFLIHKMKMCST